MAGKISIEMLYKKCARDVETISGENLIFAVRRKPIGLTVPMDVGTTNPSEALDLIVKDASFIRTPSTGAMKPKAVGNSNENLVSDGYFDRMYRHSSGSVDFGNHSTCMDPF